MDKSGLSEKGREKENRESRSNWVCNRGALTEILAGVMAPSAVCDDVQLNIEY